MNYIEWCKEFYYKHPATAVGLLLGVALGLSFAAFGFWKTFVVALCVGVGLFVGRSIDIGRWPDLGLLKERWRNLRK